jgi:hypothetical protein
MPSTSVGVHLPAEGKLPPFTGAAAWLNSEPLTPEGFRGKVVVADFCTYTCINWLRSLPYVRAWDERYRGDGLVTIGIHTPEFSFERNLDNVGLALDQMRVTYPVAVDNEYGVWNAFANHYWPALYFVDADGRIRHHRFGEGDYERSEIVIQQLLAGARADVSLGDLVTVDPSGPEVAADWGALNSPETYLGYRQTENFASPGGMERDVPKVYEAPEHVRHNHWALSGDWTAMAEATVLNEPKGRVAFRFDARDVHLVMGPAADGPCHSRCRSMARRRVPPRGERHRRGWIRRADPTAHGPADPPTRSDHRSSLRDRVPRRGRGGLRVHVRLSQQAGPAPRAV